MTNTVAEMTRTELKEMIEMIIEQKLLEIFLDPDEGLALRESVRKRLLKQREETASGERGEPLEDVVKQLGLG
jgi:hypothetical protein